MKVFLIIIVTLKWRKNVKYSTIRQGSTLVMTRNFEKKFLRDARLNHFKWKRWHIIEYHQFKFVKFQIKKNSVKNLNQHTKFGVIGSMRFWAFYPFLSIFPTKTRALSNIFCELAALSICYLWNAYSRVLCECTFLSIS